MHCKTCDIKSPEEGITGSSKWWQRTGISEYVTNKDIATMALTIISLLSKCRFQRMRMVRTVNGPDKAKSIINIDCQFGLEAGLQLRKHHPDSRLIVCSMGPVPWGLAQNGHFYGYDEAYLLSDRKLAAVIPMHGTGYFNHVKAFRLYKGFHGSIYYFGRPQTSDGDTAHVPSQVAESIGIPRPLLWKV